MAGTVSVELVTRDENGRCLSHASPGVVPVKDEDGEVIGSALLRKDGDTVVADVTLKPGLVLIDPDKTEASKQSWRGVINATREPSTEG